MVVFVRVVGFLSTALGLVAALLVAAAVAVVCQMVVMRYLLGASTVWQTEFVTYAIVAATFLGSPYVLAIGGHVNVDLLPHYLHGTTRRLLLLVAHLLGLAFCAVLFWQSALYWFENWTEGWTTQTIWALPLWIPLLPLPVGFGMLVLQYLAALAVLLAGRDEGDGSRSLHR